MVKPEPSITKKVKLSEQFDNQVIPAAITYNLDCGRFGDRLINYIKALWISHMYDIPLLYKPFSKSNKLKLSQFHLLLKDHKDKFSKQIIEIKTQNSLIEFLEAIKNPQYNIPLKLYSISFSAPIEEWEDEGFRKLLQKLIKPIKPIVLLKLPQNIITVAVHVRTGAGYDKESNINKMPTKFPPYDFYINGLKQVAELYKNQPLYIYIFTDYPEPSEICHHFENKLYELNLNDQIIIDYRKSTNSYNLNVLEDFFSMMQFDCMIRPDSSYSRAAAAVSGPIIEITPPAWGTFQVNGEGKVMIGCLIKKRFKKGGVIKELRILQ